MHFFVIVATAIGPFVHSVAANDQPIHSPKHGSISSAVQMTDGLVKKVDKSAGKVTIAHGSMASHNMPAMTMVFQAKDLEWLDTMKEGDKLRFTAEKVNGAFTVTQFEQAK
jgi:Cu/Ag efflux protein CusF